jgi:hypothetical protein
MAVWRRGAGASNRRWPRTAAEGGRPQAGLEVVEKLLTNTIDAANKTALGAVK